MIFKFNTTYNITDFKRDLQALSLDSGVRSILVYMCDENNISQEKTEVNTVLSQINKPLIGGVFPQIIFNDSNYTTGYLLVGIDKDIQPFVVNGLSDMHIDYEQVLEQTIDESVYFQTMMVLVDGLSQRIGNFVESLYSIFGSEVNYIGGGAGSLSFQQKPCVLTNDGLMEDSAVIALFAEKIATEVGHGWQIFDEGHRATSVEKNIIKEIDYTNSLQVYEKIIKNNIPTPITEDNFFTIAQSFPLGIKRLDGEYIVRDPIATNKEGHLICVGEIAEGEFIDILHGNKEYGS